jgi:hypothetical protein
MDHRSINRRVVDCVGSPSSRGQWIYLNMLTATRKVDIRGPREIRMVNGHKRTKHGKRMACWSSFPLHGVHRFELSRLLNMSTACL